MSTTDVTRWRSAPGRDIAFRWRPQYRVVWVALLLLLAVCAISAGAIFHSASLRLVTGLAGVLAVASAGQLLVVISGGIDLSVPAVMTLAGAIIVKQTQGEDGQLFVAILEALAAAGVIGLINGLLVTIGRLNAFIVTLAMNGVVTGVTLLWATTTYSPSGKAPHALTDFAHHTLFSISVVGLVGLAVLIVTGLVLRNTAIGKGFVATGTNTGAAEVIGVRIRVQRVAGYVVAALLYVAAGILLAGVVQSPNSTVGDPYQLLTIVAVALGGASLAGGPGSMLCTGGACLFVAFLNQYLSLKNFAPGITPLANGVALVVAVAMVTAGNPLRRLRLPRLRRSAPI